MNNPYAHGPHEPPTYPPYPPRGYPQNYAQYPNYPTPDIYPPKEKGFFASLFDLKFSSSITLKYTNFIYFLVLLGAGLWAVFGWLFRAFYLLNNSPELGLFWLLLGWIPIVFALVLGRMTLEFFVATARTSRDTADALAVLEQINERPRE